MKAFLVRDEIGGKKEEGAKIKEMKEKSWEKDT